MRRTVACLIVCTYNGTVLVYDLTAQTYAVRGGGRD